ncbi:MAG: murein hydrolase activator EnvC family protein [Candidatus Aminicenantales bacterium]
MKFPENQALLPLLGLVFFGLNLSIPWQAFSGQAQDLSQFETRLQKIKQEINLLERRIKEEKEKESTLLSQLNQLSLEKKLIRREINLNTAERQRVDREISFLQAETKSLQHKLNQQRQQMEKTLVSLYKHGRLSWLDFFFRAKSLTSLVAESKRLEMLIHHQNNTLNEFLQTEARLNTTTRKLEAKKKELGNLHELALEKKKALEQKERELKEFTIRVQRNRRLFEQTLKEYQERVEQLQSLMDKIMSQELSLPFPFVPFYEKKGKLPWPVTGKIITAFGLQRHPQFNTITLNNGIEIAPAGGERTIKAVHAGKVVYGDNFQGYGDLLIIDHGMNYYSLYGHCAEFLVNKGDWVREGQPIAIVGDSGSLKGLCLYFEIRYKTKALDPLQWLRRK